MSMNRKFQDRDALRRGAFTVEAMISLVLASVVVAGVAQLAGMTSRQFRVCEERALATLEAGNVMEQLMARPWSEVTAEKAAQLSLSKGCLQRLPDPQLQVKVTAEGETGESRRIDVQVRWRQGPNRSSAPVRLVAWRYRNEEARP